MTAQDPFALESAAKLMQDPVHYHALARPQTPALAYPEGIITYRDLDRIVHGTSVKLASTRAPRIALCLPRDWKPVVIILACLRYGISACPISTRLPPTSVRARVDEVAAGLLVAARTDRAADVVACEDVIGEGDPTDAKWNADASATLVFTTGTTGESKAAVHSIGNHVYSALGSNENIPLSPGDRWWLSLPLNHVGGLGILFRCILAGATVVIAPSWSEAANLGVTHMSLVPTQLREMVHEKAPKKLKAVLVGGSACSSGLVDVAVDQGFPVHTTYGMTETTSQVATTPPQASAEQLRSSGQLLRWRELKIGESGEILLRGPVLCKGYLVNGAITRLTGDDGWFHSGDLGRLDCGGFVHVFGRLDNMFISGGENIYPEEVERALCTLDSVIDAVVVPVDDGIYGQRPVAFIRPDGELPTPEILRACLKSTLPSFKIPDAVHRWPRDIATRGGKIDRLELARSARSQMA